MHNENSPPCGKYISWHALLGGSLVALGLTFLFNLLTIALGLSLFTHNPSGQMILTFFGFAWILIGVYIILFLAGWVTGRIVSYKHSLHNANGCLHGFLAWTVYLIISLFVLSHVGSDSAAVLLRTTAVQSQTNTELSVSTPTENNEITQETKNIRTAGLETFATFFIFLVGAIGCTVGACYGIREGRKCHEKCTSTEHDKNS